MCKKLLGVSFLGCGICVNAGLVVVQDPVVAAHSTYVVGGPYVGTYTHNRTIHVQSTEAGLPANERVELRTGFLTLENINYYADLDNTYNGHNTFYDATKGNATPSSGVALSSAQNNNNSANITLAASNTQHGTYYDPNGDPGATVNNYHHAVTMRLSMDVWSHYSDTRLRTKWAGLTGGPYALPPIP